MNTPDKVHQPCKIVGISGSIRSGSYTTLAVRLALKGAEELECQTKTFLWASSQRGEEEGGVITTRTRFAY